MDEIHVDSASFLGALRQQDIDLEQIELILYNMLQLTQQSAADDCSAERRQQLQEQVEALLAEINDIASNGISKV